VPAGVPPHRDPKTITPPKIRLEMVASAIASNPAFRMSTVEADRPDVSYTVDTLSQLTRQHPDVCFHLLMSADWLPSLSTWREPSRIAQLARIVAVNRGASPLPDLDRLRESLGDDVVRAIQFVMMPAMPHAATDIRTRVGSGRSIRYLTPDPVIELIERHKLYRESVPRRGPDVLNI